MARKKIRKTRLSGIFSSKPDGVTKRDVYFAKYQWNNVEKGFYPERYKIDEDEYYHNLNKALGFDYDFDDEFAFVQKNYPKAVKQMAHDGEIHFKKEIGIKNYMDIPKEFNIPDNTLAGILSRNKGKRGRAKASTTKR